MRFDDVVALLAERRKDLGPLVARAAEVTTAYNGDLVLPLPELDANERTAVPNLLKQGLDQMAMRISSTMPDVFCPPERPGQKRSESQAVIRRQANLGWWERSTMTLLMGRRARHSLGYASSCVEVVPDFERKIPRWQLHHPLRTYPAPTLNPDDVLPSDCIVTYDRTWRWLSNNYDVRTLDQGPSAAPDDRYELVCYTDAQETILGVMGRGGEARDPHRAPFLELLRTPNRANQPTICVAGRITLDRPMGAYDGMVGLFQQTAKLMALESIAVTRDVFADEWLIARPNEVPAVVQMADGRRGVLGIVRGGDINSKHSMPGYKTTETLAMLERAQRLEGGVPAEFGGESASTVRTGRRGDAILSAVVDFPVQEAQRIFEVSLQAENEIAVNVAKGYFGSQPKSFYVGWAGAKGQVDYVPNRDFTSTDNQVTYAHAGADINNLVIGLGQRLGTGIMSKRGAMRLDPLNDDPERTAREIVAEQLEDATLASLANAVMGGTMDLTDLNEIHDKVLTGKSSLIEAIRAQQQEAQSRQASSGAPGTPEAPLAPGTPEAQAGLNPVPPSIGPTPNEEGLSQLVHALRGGARGAA